MSNVFVFNQSPPTITISQIDFSGVTASCDTFCPCNPSDNGTFTISNIGESTLDITYSPFGIPPYLNGCIEVTDSLGGIQNFNVGTGTSGVASFPNVTYDGVIDIQITVYDNLCNPIPETPTPTPTLNPTPTPTPNPTPGSTPDSTPASTPGSTPASTPTSTPISTYTYLGRTTPDAIDSVTACATYLTIRGYVSLKSTLASITAGDVIYDSYPSSPTNGNNNWIALKDGGVGDAYSFQINTVGVVTTVGGNCNGTTPTPTPDPTTTPSPTPDPTTTPSPTPTLPCDCVEYVNVEVTTGGNITYLDCSGGPQVQTVSVGPEVIGVATCIDKNTLGGTASFTIDSIGPCCTVVTPTPTSTQTSTPTSTPTETPTPTNPPVWYQILDCDDSSVGFSIAYTAGVFTLNERCLAVNISTRTVIVIGSTSTLPGGILYTLTSLGATGCPATPTPTQTETQTPTPSVTIGASPTQTETPTQTPSETPTQTPTETTTQTPTNTETPTQTVSETPTQTPSETPTQTPTETTTQTPTNTETPTQTPTNTETPSPTPNPTQTQTPSETPTNTPTQTQTPSPTPTPGFAVQFVDCSNSTNIFRFNDPAIPSTTGVTYYITGSTSFDGCATTVVNDGSGPQYDGAGVSFLMTGAGCGDPVCPRSSNKAALLTRCSDGAVFYFNVEEDTAFVGAAYVYSGVCYSFVEFSGPGGDNIGSPLYKDCIECLGQPTPTPTPYPTPTNTPTVSATPPACSFTTFCLSSSLSSVINYNGNYTNSGFYNGKPYYVGDGATTGYIYYVTGSTEYWCLSNSLGGTCILQGASPCYSQCPDILANGFTGGVCPTPTPTPINCNTFNFNAYFDCDWEPLPTPTPSIACDDVNFDISYFGVTPTPSPTGIICDGTAVIFSMSGYTPAVTPTIPLTPTVTITRTVDVAGQATFNMLDETFNCVSVKVLTNCNTGKELYTSSNLSYSGITVVTGMTFFALINNENVCVTYTRDDSNFSSNSIVNQIFQIYSNCANCSNVPTPTPSVTTTPTQTPSPTAGLTPTATSTPPVTPTQTKTQTPTPSPTSTLGSTPTQTPSNTPTETPPATPTQTQTASNTPTPSPTQACYLYVVSADDGTDDKNSYEYYYTRCNGTAATGSVVNLGPSRTICARLDSVSGEGPVDIVGPGASCSTNPPVWVYVYQSCQQILFGNFTSFAQVIQTQQVSFTVVVGESFKDDQGNCWVYNGRFESDYIAPPTMTPITFQGDYFANAATTVYASCDDCLTPEPPTQQTVTGAGGGMQPCIGGGIDDFMGAYVSLDAPVTVDTTIGVVVYFQYGDSGVSCSSTLSNNNSTTFGVFIPAGQSYGTVDACTQGQYFSTGADICGSCVSDSDNPNINFGAFGC